MSVVQFQLPIYQGATPTTRICEFCPKEITGRSDKRFCSVACTQSSARRRHAGEPQRNRACLICKKAFDIEGNKKYCSRKCSRRAAQKQTAAWRTANPGHMRVYNRNRPPGYDVTKRAAYRLKAIEALGGRCVVCGIEDPLWLEIDFIETTRGKPHRHPRHANFVLQNLARFRLLCCNHHRELSTTGMIRGTDIRQ